MFAQPQEAKPSRALVERDLRAYFADILQRTDLARVDFEALGEGPAAKVAKLYFWVRVYDQKRIKVAEGAVRVATVDRKTFEGDALCRAAPGTVRARIASKAVPARVA